MIRALHVILVLTLLLLHVAKAEIYELPPEGYDVIGAVSTIAARREDTLVDIARRHGLGYQDIVRANPEVNVWVPGEGTEVILPTQYVLPPGPRDGVILNLAEYRLYYFPKAKEGETAYVMTYPISIGRMDWETPLGKTSVISKVRNPSWYVPKSVLAEHEADGNPLPRIVPPGPDNPLGEYAMRLGLPGYLIHGTNRPAGVGMRVTHGCVRMFPEDIEFLFGKIDLNTTVRIINEPIKMGWSGNDLVMEVHPVLEVVMPDVADEAVDEAVDEATDETAEDPLEVVVEVKDPLTYVTEQFIETTAERPGQLDWDRVEQLVNRSEGIPTSVGQGIKNAATSAAFE
jgi:L,D-transpeptidase ErfK/SrfK